MPRLLRHWRRRPACEHRYQATARRYQSRPRGRFARRRGAGGLPSRRWAGCAALWSRPSARAGSRCLDGASRLRSPGEPVAPPAHIHVSLDGGRSRPVPNAGIRDVQDCQDHGGDKPPAHPPADLPPVLPSQLLQQPVPHPPRGNCAPSAGARSSSFLRVSAAEVVAGRDQKAELGHPWKLWSRDPTGHEIDHASGTQPRPLERMPGGHRAPRLARPGVHRGMGITSQLPGQSHPALLLLRESRRHLLRQ